MAEETELLRCENKLREDPETWNWLLLSPNTWVPITEVAKQYHVRVQTVYRWISGGLIPGVMVDPFSNRKKIPRTGLIIFFGRQMLK